MPLVPKLTPPKVSPGTWPAFNRYLYVNFKKTEEGDLGPLGPLVLYALIYIRSRLRQLHLILTEF